VTLHEVAESLREHGVQPSAQRVAVARFALKTDAHPSADQVFSVVRKSFPMISRATVYNTLNLLVAKGLLRELVLAPGKIVFDPKLDAHHHFIDESSGRIHDVPWDAVRVSRVESLRGFEVREYQVVMRGRASAQNRK
jgi:Fur family iron response transcriptional regulator